MNLKNITDFDSLLKNEKKIIIAFFYAEWASGSKIMEQEFDLLDINKFLIVKINIDEHPALASKYGIRGVPTLLIFKNGSIVKTKVGICRCEDICEGMVE